MTFPQHGATPDDPAGAAPDAPRARAERLFRDALDAHNAGRAEAAAAGYRAALAAWADHPHALNNLAILERTSGRPDAAAALYRRLLAAAPEEAHAYSNYSRLLTDLGREAEAVTLLHRAVALRPDHPDAYFNLGVSLPGAAAAKQHDAAAQDAMTAYRRAVHLNPGMVQALSNIASLHAGRGELETAVRTFAQALQRGSTLAATYNGLGEALKEQGRVAEALAVFQEGLKQHPDCRPMHSNLLFALHYSAAIPAETAFRAHVAWGDRHGPARLSAGRRFARDRSPDRRLRVGYLSPDFCTHSCAYFTEALIREHDREAVEVTCYMTQSRHDATTDRFRAAADRWRTLLDPDDGAAAARIEADGLDILVDLGGHTGCSRVSVLAHRPAPVQATWLGYPNTTGMAAVDYRLTDAVADPEGEADRRHTERLVRLPGGFHAFHPVIDAPARPTPPVADTGTVTFGSFNNLAKVTADVVRTWSEILARVPGARLVVKSKALGDPGTRDRYRVLFERHGVGGRVDLLGRLEPVTNHLRAYDRIDIGLDPFPYNGTTTTCEALWMGVPVVTLRGATHVARVGASLLTQIGLTELIAEDEAAYVATAVALAGDRDRLARLRGGMRDRLLASTLTDHAGFARKMEAAYRRMWHAWLECTTAAGAATDR